MPATLFWFTVLVDLVMISLAGSVWLQSQQPGIAAFLLMVPFSFTLFSSLMCEDSFTGQKCVYIYRFGHRFLNVGHRGIQWVYKGWRFTWLWPKHRPEPRLKYFSNGYYGTDPKYMLSGGVWLSEDWRGDPFQHEGWEK